MENDKCDYKCNEGHGGKDIIFKRIVGEFIIFFCRKCGKEFNTQDKESCYIHPKVECLKRKYP